MLHNEASSSRLDLLVVVNRELHRTRSSLDDARSFLVRTMYPVSYRILELSCRPMPNRILELYRRSPGVSRQNRQSHELMTEPKKNPKTYGLVGDQCRGICGDGLERSIDGAQY